MVIREITGFGSFRESLSLVQPVCANSKAKNKGDTCFNFMWRKVYNSPWGPTLGPGGDGALNGPRRRFRSRDGTPA